MSTVRTHSIGFDALPAGGLLLVPNQLRLSDLQQLSQLLGSRLACLYNPQAHYAPGVAEYLAKGLHPSLHFDGFPGDSEDTRRSVRSSLDEKQALLFVPPVGAVTPASLCSYPGDMLSSVLTLARPVAPLFVIHSADTRLSVESTPASATLHFGEILPLDETNLPSIMERWLAAGEAAFSATSLFDSHLGYLLLKGLKKHSKTNIHDGIDSSDLDFSKLLAVACAFSQVIRGLTKKKRVGIVLPPGRGAFIANLAVIFAGKVPVNFNFTAGRASQQAAIRMGETDHYITVDKVMRKLQDFPWPAQKNITYLERVIPGLKSKIGIWLGLSKVLPASVLAKLLRLPSKGGDEEAVLLFTSGSSGDPKGVPLTHRNLISNIMQFSSRLNLEPGKETILGCLPMFHSFGITVTFLYPVLEGINVVSWPTPVEVVKLGELVEAKSVSVVITTPTFLRGYLKRVKREQLASIKFMITGAEKLPPSLAVEFEKRFGKVVLEGYGLTETSPVSNVNLMDPPNEENLPLVPGHRPGSVGQMLPGLAIRVTDPGSGQKLPLDRSGMISFKGPNVFRGYLNQPQKSAEVLADGWFRTGDIGRMDADGFLFIEGRMSRFSKIAGEMVPHEVVEEHIIKSLNLEAEAERQIVVMSVPDEDKGEALVLLSTVAGNITQELGNLRYSLLERGVPALWIPKRMLKVEHIPVLASGKLDLNACQKMALQAG